MLGISSLLGISLHLCHISGEHAGNVGQMVLEREEEIQGVWKNDKNLCEKKLSSDSYTFSVHLCIHWLLSLCTLDWGCGWQFECYFLAEAGRWPRPWTATHLPLKGNNLDLWGLLHPPQVLRKRLNVDRRQKKIYGGCISQCDSNCHTVSICFGWFCGQLSVGVNIFMQDLCYSFLLWTELWFIFENINIGTGAHNHV